MIVKIKIPENSRSLVKAGEKIEFGKPLFEKTTHQKFDISISQRLGIKPEKIFQFLKKLVGDTVSKDEVIAFKKKLLGGVSLKSPVDGTIKEIDHQEGKIIIYVDDKEKKTIFSSIKGEIVTIKHDFLEVDLGRGEEYSLKESTASFGGKCIYLNESNLLQLKAGDIAGCVIIADKLSDILLAKLEALGAAGLVTTNKFDKTISLPQAELKNSGDFKQIFSKKEYHCLIDDQSAKIYFYQ